MILIWPSYLPMPSIDFSYEATANVTRTRMDTGLIRQRRRSLTQIRVVSARWEMTDVEMELFAAFFQDVVSGGADWFIITLPLGGDFKDYQLRFTSGYRTSYRAHLNWQVSAQLELFNQTPFDYETNMLVFFSDGDPDAFLAIMASLHHTVHVSLPAI